MSALADRVRTLEARIRRACEDSDRSPSEVELLPVSKRHPVALLREAQALGFSRFGENYVQEGAAKAADLPNAAFLLLGPLQRNKAKLALLTFQELMTLDRPELAHRLRNLAAELGLTRPVWIQVDLWDEATKVGGASEADLPGVVEALGDDPRLPLQGFLAVPPPDLPDAFQDLARLRTRWQDRLGRRLRLSMGMSDDLEAAIHAGSDQVRVGTDFFGLRG